MLPVEPLAKGLPLHAAATARPVARSTVRAVASGQNRPCGLHVRRSEQSWPGYSAASPATRDRRLPLIRSKFRMYAWRTCQALATPRSQAARMRLARQPRKPQQDRRPTPASRQVRPVLRPPALAGTRHAGRGSGARATNRKMNSTLALTPGRALGAAMMTVHSDGMARDRCVPVVAWYQPADHRMQQIEQAYPLA